MTIACATAATDSAHHQQWALCTRLEALADGLPALPPAEALRRLIASFETCQQALGEPLPDGDPRFAAAREYRTIDSCHADDLIAALADYADRGCLHPERLSYMLRCFFDGRRRAITLERALLGLSPL